MLNKNALVSVKDYFEYAEKVLPINSRAYYFGGSDETLTLQENENAFQRYLILPKVLRNVSDMDTKTTILGQVIKFPVCISPFAMQCSLHPDGEIATAKAAVAVGSAMTLSTFSTKSLEDVAAANGDGLRFFQLYVCRDRKLTADFVRRAEASGYRALIVTVDAPTGGKNRLERKHNFHLQPHLSYQNFPKSLLENGANELSFIPANIDSSVTWEDLKWLKSITRLPIVLKGILRADDAIMAVNSGVDAIFVSNHGGRMIDSTPATIDALAYVIEAVKGRCEVYVDGGFRTGSDVFKALALGARAVFIARPIVAGLTYDGENGARQVLEMLRDELKTAMALSGCRSVADIKRDLVISKLRYTSQL